MPKFSVLSLDGCSLEYLRFGTGKRVLVMLPGLGDSLRSMKGMALPMALVYRAYGKKYTVYVFGRGAGVPQGITTRDMARDLAQAMELLGITGAYVLGVSMGGMIAQHLAADYPHKVEKLVLAVTAPGVNPIMEEALGEWIALAEKKDYTGFMKSNLQRIYSSAYCRRNGWLAPLIGKLTKPGDTQDFFIQARACLTHDGRAALERIRARTLVVGGEQDRTLGSDASRELAAGIPGARLKMYPQWGHGLYEEAKDFHWVVMEFFR